MDLQRMVLGSFQTNCYILKTDDNKCAVVDPGYEADKIIEAIENSGAELSCFLLTHGHIDHSGMLPALWEKYSDVPAYLGAKETMGRLPAFPDLSDYKEKIVRIKDGDHIALGNLDIEVIETPGHSKGSVVYKVVDILFTGDTLFYGRSGATDYYGASYQELQESLRKISTIEGEYRICPGHGELSIFSKEKQYNPALCQD